MQPIRIPTPDQLKQAPELAALSTLDAALVTAVHALAAAYPTIWWIEWPDDMEPDPDFRPGVPRPPRPRTIPLAGDIIDASQCLRDSLVAYWAARTTTQLAFSFDADVNIPF